MAVAVLVSIPLFAQSADVALSLRLINQPLINSSAEYTLEVANRGPARARAIEVVWMMPAVSYSYDNACRASSLEVV